MGILRGLSMALSGIRAQQARAGTAASNIANSQSTRGGDGNPHRARQVQLAENREGGVDVKGVRQSSRPHPITIEPSHPHANSRGQVKHSNVSVTSEMLSLVSVRRGYEANVESFKVLSDMSRWATQERPLPNAPEVEGRRERE